MKTESESNPGVGVVKAGWHCGSQPGGSGDAHGGCPAAGSISGMSLSTVPSGGAAGLFTAANRTISFRAQATTTGECTIPSYKWDFGDRRSARGSAVSHAYARGTYTAKVTARAACGCPQSMVKTVAVNVSSVEVITANITDANGAPDPDGVESNAALSFVVAPAAGVTRTDGSTLGQTPVTVNYIGQLGPQDSIQWRIEAFPGLDNPRSYGGVSIRSPLMGSGTGKFGDPWKGTTATPGTIQFDPNPPAHFPTAYRNAVNEGGTIADNGTRNIDVYRHNPRLAYSIGGTVYRNTGISEPIPPVIIRMDDKDMIRQEYITHLASVDALSSYNKSNGTPMTAVELATLKNKVKNDVKVPTRARLVTPASLGNGIWTPGGYWYQYIVEDGMKTMWLFYKGAFAAISKSITLSAPFAGVTATLLSTQTPVVTSAYRNPERNEVFSTALASRHMLGRALDVAISNVLSLGTRANPTPSFDRGVAFYKAWEVIHGANPTQAKSSSVTVPWADFWQLEGIKSNPILKSNAGFVDNAADGLDNNSNGIPDGYERTGHLHMQDDPNVGVHL